MRAAHQSGAALQQLAAARLLATLAAELAGIKHRWGPAGMRRQYHWPRLATRRDAPLSARLHKPARTSVRI